uniref:tRNA (guanine(46)-N(7))-methyltransferase n=1 Tax=Pseudo-nitzschia australis TaxID=44445 RepID=A0A7S4ER99_9STRA|mmetsp:Transcript_1004/g.2314  ORF Transcript_1004/g.2314 Transcript_1004/m.2314 type:complete len:356 (+) Transcript_1004:130-1197(+)|eukprot:CAMPEP_0168191674 /NCGR_PEP_ID=MMETSP0139_2-20121125/17645_1 /TAXON_ID=44445 /ORGANISM="Pseudo-nitzschia australis, Strain 10249 10 AB" /LENGTH=355 /DNA_ID=CAMNT_0008114871 /DNA_START=75 /DNA_END=1142 /DNA_ORIENTATION=+
MKGCARSWSSLLPLMIIGSSLFWKVARSTSKRGLSLFVEAVPKRTHLVSEYFGNGSRKTIAFAVHPPSNKKRDTTKALLSATTIATDDSNNKDSNADNVDIYVTDPKRTPWNDPKLADRTKKDNQSFRSRQHVNPLARKFQKPAILSDNWPIDVFEDLSKPIFLDIGCSRGGFLLDMAVQRPDDYNYLGLEIRPIVVYHAQERVQNRKLQGGLDFVGCNANVDLERLLALLTTTTEEQEAIRGSVEMVTIQFPDPHFKARHAKRRVVTLELVQTLARFMPEGATVFLQSDIQSVLDEMRLQFREQSEYFRDTHESMEEYIPENILGVPTEREISVLERDLPVFRATFTRTDKATL